MKPSILHGDLWSGNIAAVGGEPAIFDPAVYYGGHEAEWGMSWCASLGPAFWKGYRELIPKDEGFERRFALYEAYRSSTTTTLRWRLLERRAEAARAQVEDG